MISSYSIFNTLHTLNFNFIDYTKDNRTYIDIRIGKDFLIHIIIHNTLNLGVFQVFKQNVLLVTIDLDTHLDFTNCLELTTKILEAANV